MKAQSTFTAMAALGLALAFGSSALAATNETQAKPVAPLKMKQPSKLTDGECEGMNGTIKTDKACATQKSCTRVNGEGEVIRVGCIDNKKN